MPNQEIELDQLDFITIGTVGPKGRRQFNIQAGQGSQIITLIIEKEQARQLADAIEEILDDLQKRDDDTFKQPIINLGKWDMALRDPVEPQFRVAKMGLGYDEDRDRIILVAQELLVTEEEEEEADPLTNRPSIVRMWGTREQYKALSVHSLQVVDAGRADPRENGYVIYYWT
jgi:uncharacterized repeat protein (TIGR03847 family)